MKQTEQKIAIYSRKSKFTGKGESIENQIELCKSYISTHFPEITAENILIFEDEGYSGGHLERPKFKEMMSLVKKRKISYIICYRLDRISRNIGDFAGLIEELNNLGTSFVSIKEQFDTSSPLGRAMMYIASVFSQLERETIAERIRDNMRELAKTGRWLGGVTPTGYASEAVEKITVDGKFKKAFKLVPIDEEIILVKLIFSKFIETNSLSATETYLIQNNYKTKNGRNFSRFSIKNILENPVYMVADKSAFVFFEKNKAEIFVDKKKFDGKSGIMAYSKTIQKRGKAHEIKGMSDWIIAVGEHNGIISGKDFIKVQSQLASNKDKNYRKPRSNIALLSGVLYCSCGEYMRPKMSSRINSDGEFIYSYLCTMKEKSKMKKCEMKNPNGNILDKLVCEEIKKLSENSDVYINELKCNKNKQDYDNQIAKSELERLQKLKENSEKEIANLTKILAKTTNSGAQEHILKQIEELDISYQNINESISNHRKINSEEQASVNEIELMKDMLRSFAITFEHMSVVQKRLVIKALVKKVIWDGENAHIYLFGSMEDDVELPPTQSIEETQP